MDVSLYLGAIWMVGNIFFYRYSVVNYNFSWEWHKSGSGIEEPSCRLVESQQIFNIKLHSLAITYFRRLIEDRFFNYLPVLCLKVPTPIKAWLSKPPGTLRNTFSYSEQHKVWNSLEVKKQMSFKELNHQDQNKPNFHQKSVNELSVSSVWRSHMNTKTHYKLDRL